MSTEEAGQTLWFFSVLLVTCLGIIMWNTFYTIFFLILIDLFKVMVVLCFGGLDTSYK